MSTPAPLASPTVEPAAPAGRAPTGRSDANHRLVIEESGEAGFFVYRVVDRSTGQVVTELPCETAPDVKSRPDIGSTA